MIQALEYRALDTGPRDLDTGPRDLDTGLRDPDTGLRDPDTGLRGLRGLRYSPDMARIALRQARSWPSTPLYRWMVRHGCRQGGPAGWPGRSQK